MKRAQFFQCLFALGQTIVGSKGCILLHDDGSVTPCEERCPLGHKAKPKFMYIDGHPSDVPTEEVTHVPEQRQAEAIFLPSIPSATIPAYDTYKTNLRICSVCGVVYIGR